jgi:hypothetical protein
MNEIHLSIPGSVRSKKNHPRIFRHGRKSIRMPSCAYETWEKQSRLFLWASRKVLIPPLTCPVHIEAHFYIKGPLLDLSGAMEGLADMIQGVLIANDKQIYSWDGSRVHRDKDNPRTEVIIRYEEA